VFTSASNKRQLCEFVKQGPIKIENGKIEGKLACVSMSRPLAGQAFAAAD
jgi:hypothetical protein